MDQESDKQVRTLQIIVLAMGLGLVAFGVVAVVIGGQMEDDPSLAKMLLLVLAFLGVSEFVAYLVLRSVTLNALRNQMAEASPAEADKKTLAAFSTLTLIRSAMTEGWGLFGVVIVLVTGVTLAFVAPLLALALLAAGFPTRQKLADLAATMTGRNPFAG